MQCEGGKHEVKRHPCASYLIGWVREAGWGPPIKSSPAALVDLDVPRYVLTEVSTPSINISDRSA